MFSGILVQNNKVLFGLQLLDDNNCVFYDGSSVSAQDLLGPVSSMYLILDIKTALAFVAFH